MTKIYTSFLFVLLILPASVSAQKQGQEKIDSLTAEWPKAKNDSVRYSIMTKLAWPYMMTGKIDSAIYAAQNSLKLAEKLSYTYGIANAHNDLGNIYNLIDDYPEAIRAFKIAIKPLEGSDEKRDKILLGWTYSNLSEAYLKWGNYDEALKNIMTALQYKKETGEVYWLGSSYYNLGEIYIRQGKYPEAHKSYQSGLQVAQKADNTHHLILGHLGSGDISSLQGKYSEALESYRSALKIAEQTDEKFGIAQSYQRIGETYNKLNHPKEAKIWLQKSLDLSGRIGAKKTMKESYRTLVSADSLLGNFTGAFENYKMYEFHKDIIFNEKNTHKVAYLEMNYEFEKQQDSIRLVNEKEIAIRDAVLEVHRKEKWFFIGGLVSLTIIGGLLFYQNRLRKKKNRQLDEANRIKTRFFSILTHDLRSPMAKLILFLNLKKENSGLLDEESNKKYEQQTAEGAENLLAVMEDLLLWSKGQMKNFKPQLKNLAVKDLFEDTQKHFFWEEKVSFIFENKQNISLVSDENYLKTILRNLTSNAIKALQNTENPQIIWKARQEKNSVILSITDNGPGADNKKFRALYDDKEVVGVKTGLGLHLVRDLANAINCKIEVESEITKGTTIHLIFE